jgi:hypothetical protein
MRILKIELPATIASVDPDVSLASDLLREQLRRELDALKEELGESVRQRAVAYFPSDYTVFVRFSFWVDGSRANVTVWIDDPTVRWPSGLFARRAWKLSIPIVSHIVAEVFQARAKSIRIDVDEKRARIVSFAALRGWQDPAILAVAVVLISTLYWLFLHHWVWAWLSRLL